MALFEWNEQLSVGVKEFDAQHQQLIALLNTLAEATAAGHGNDVLGKTLDAVVEYTKTHFAAEERKMHTHGFPEFAAHKKEHDELVAQAADLQRRLRGGTSPTFQTMQFLKGWLNNHIMKADKGYTHFLNSKGVR